MDDDDRVSLDPLKPTQALKALLSVDPDAPEDDDDRCPKLVGTHRCRLPKGHLGPCQATFPA